MDLNFSGLAARIVALTAVFGGSAILVAACSDGGGSGDAEVINAINILDNAGLHGIDDSINKEQTIPANARTTALKLQAVTELTEWPSELEDDAEALVSAFEELASALNGDGPDLAKAGEAAKKAHDVEHDFSAGVWAHLYEEAGVESGGAGH